MSEQYGLNIPASGEKGKTFWSKIIALFWWCINHTHDGINSASLTLPAMPKEEQILIADDWEDAGSVNGIYRQTVAIPNGRTYSNSLIKFNIMDGETEGDMWYPETEKINDVSFYIYSNDNTIGVKVRYA